MSLADFELLAGQTVEILTPSGNPTRRIGKITAVLESGLYHVQEADRTKLEVLPGERLRVVWSDDELSLPSRTVFAPSFTGSSGSTAGGGIGGVDDALLNQHIFDQNNPHNVTKQQVGLGSVDNTSDANKPLSLAALAVRSQQQNLLDRYLQGDTVVRVSGTVYVQQGVSSTYTCDTVLPNPSYQWFLGGTLVPGATQSSFVLSPQWLDDNRAITCTVTSEGLAYRSNAIVLRVDDVEPQTAYDFYLSPKGDDSAAGTSPETAWRSFNPLALYMDNSLRAGQTVRVRVATGIYVTSYSVSRFYTATTRLFIDLEPGVTIQRSDLPVSHAIQARGNIHMTVKSIGQAGTQAIIKNFDRAAGAAIGAANSATLRICGIRIDSCFFGVTLENTANLTLRDATIRNSSTAAYRQNAATGSGVVINSAFISKSGVTTSLLSQPQNAKFLRVSVQPNVVDTALETNGAIFKACQLGTQNINVLLSDTAQDTQQTFEDCYLNAAGTLFGRINMLRCYGRATFAVSGNASRPASIINHCVFVGAPLTYPQTFIYRSANLGVSPVTVSNTVFTNFTEPSIIGTNFTLVESGVWNSNCFIRNCCFFANSGTWVPLINTSVSGSLLADPLLGSRNSVNQRDYVISESSPCIGAGVSGTDIGFRLTSIYVVDPLQRTRLITEQDLRDVLQTTVVNSASVSTGDGGSLTVSVVPPLGPIVGDKWVDASTGVCFIWTATTSGEQWVEYGTSAGAFPGGSGGSGGGTGLATIPAQTMLGNLTNSLNLPTALTREMILSYLDVPDINDVQDMIVAELNGGDF